MDDETFIEASAYLTILGIMLHTIMKSGLT